MFAGHYGIAFAARRVAPSVPLWVTFLAVQMLDLIWAPLVLFGVEKVNIVPGITASNALDLFYMPYTHSLVGALMWSLIAVALWARRPGRNAAAFVIGAAVLSHWLLDFLVHRPDLPLIDDVAKVGLGLWNQPAVALGLEAALLFGGIAAYTNVTRPRPAVLILGVLMFVVQAVVFFGPPPTSGRAAAITALGAYLLYAAVAAWLEAPRSAGVAADESKYILRRWPWRTSLRT